MYPSERLELIEALAFPALTWLPWSDPYELPGVVAQVAHISSVCEAGVGGFFVYISQATEQVWLSCRTA